MKRPGLLGVSIGLSLCWALVFGSGLGLVYGGSPEPGEKAGERFVGPNIDAVMTVTCCTPDPIVPGRQLYTLTIVGSCRTFGQMTQHMAVSFTEQKTVDPADFPLFTEANFVFQRREGEGPPGCHSINGGEDVIITGVTKFNNTGTEIGAEVVVSFVEPK